MVVISNYFFLPSVSSLLDVQRNDDLVSAIKLHVYDQSDSPEEAITFYVRLI